jgi:ribulose-phosphate 3-epimerase
MSASVAGLIKQTGPVLSVGATSADLMALGGDVALLERCGCRMLHFDVMDGHFAPMLTVGPGFIKAVRTAMLKDVHLMIEDPYDSISQYAAAGADIITVHVESCVHALACLQLIRGLKNANDPQRGIAAGIAVNPGTQLCTLKPLIHDADVVTLVAVNPGFLGQKPHAATAARARQVREMVLDAGASTALCIDGGITKENIGGIAAMGPDIVVSGSAVFEKKMAAENFSAMTSLLKR